MKKILLFTFVALCLHNNLCNAQAPVCIWAKTQGNNFNDGGRAVATDIEGNVYMAGSFKSPTIVFGTTTLTNCINTGDVDNPFLAKYDANGNVLWAINGWSPTLGIVNSISIDSLGYIYMVGEYRCFIQFDTTRLWAVGPSTGYDDAFIVKYDANGNLKWVKKVGGKKDEIANSVAVDALGNFYVAGSFESDTLIFGLDTLNSMGGMDVFLAKYDTNGNVIWVKCAGGTNNDNALSVAVDKSNNPIITGYMTSPSISFDTTTFYNTGMFLVKYNQNGNVIWAEKIISTAWDRATSVAVDANNNYYITGRFESHYLHFGITALTNTNACSDIFLAKCDENGNMLWAKSAGGNGYDFVYSVAVDNIGNAYITGASASDTIIFGTSTLVCTTHGVAEIIVAKYDANGNPLWGIRANGGNDSFSVALDKNNNVYVTGGFRSTNLIFPPITLNNCTTYLGYEDIFLAKFASSVGVDEVSQKQNLLVYPNPSSGIINITLAESSKNTKIDILNSCGQLILTKNINNQSSTTIDVSNQAKGLYFIKVRTGNEVVVRKFVKE